jgi:hypothetical protein
MNRIKSNISSRRQPSSPYGFGSAVLPTIGLILLASGSCLSLFSLMHALAEPKLPTGSVLDYYPGQKTGTTTTPDGKQVNVVLTQYDQWWLSKSEAEQSEWLDLWLESVQPVAKSNWPGLTFVKFMTQVMNSGITIREFNISLYTIQNQNALIKFPSYIQSYAGNRCQNYRAGMSYDEGRDSAIRSLSPGEKDELARSLTLGSVDGKPTPLGIYLHALRSEYSMSGLCGELADKLKKNSAYN